MYSISEKVVRTGIAFKAVRDTNRAISTNTFATFKIVLRKLAEENISRLTVLAKACSRYVNSRSSADLSVHLITKLLGNATELQGCDLTNTLDTCCYNCASHFSNKYAARTQSLLVWCSPLPRSEEPPLLTTRIRLRLRVITWE